VKTHAQVLDITEKVREFYIIFWMSVPRTMSLHEEPRTQANRHRIRLALGE